MNDMLAVAAALAKGDHSALGTALEAQASRHAKMHRFLLDLHYECKDQRAAAPSDLSNADDFLRDYLLLDETTACDYLNAGELPTLNALVANLFDPAHADPAALLIELKGHMRKHGLASLDAAYEDARSNGWFR